MQSLCLETKGVGGVCPKHINDHHQSLSSPVHQVAAVRFLLRRGLSWSHKRWFSSILTPDYNYLLGWLPCPFPIRLLRTEVYLVLERGAYVKRREWIKKTQGAENVRILSWCFQVVILIRLHFYVYKLHTYCLIVFLF